MDEVDYHSNDKSKVFFGIKLGKNLSIFLVCLLLTSVFWFLNAFTKDYSTELNYPIKYVNLPEHEIIVNDLPRFLAVEVNGFGFKLLSFYIFGSLDSVDVDYSTGIKKYRKGGSLSIIPRTQLKSIASSVLPADIRIEGIAIDSLRICTDPISDKIIRIRPEVNYTLENYYYLKDSIEVAPKSVLLSGPTTLLEKLHELSTQTISLGVLDKSVTKDVGLNLPDNFSCLTKKVRVSLKVDRTTEKEIIVPIDITSTKNGNTVKLFPQFVKVKVKIGLSDFDKISAKEFRFEVNVQEIELTKKYLKVKLVKQAQGTEIISFSPRRVEYILKN